MTLTQLQYIITIAECGVSVYLWKSHPLAKKKSITFPMLADYPFLSFEQGDTGSFYFAEEILATQDYPRIIRANDRATMLNLMTGLNAYTLCSGIIYNEFNGTEYVAVPYRAEKGAEKPVMEIGYLTHKNMTLSTTGARYIEKLKYNLQS